MVSESGHVSLGLGTGQMVFLSLAQTSDPGCVSFTGSGFRVRVLRDWLVSCSSWLFDPTGDPLCVGICENFTHSKISIGDC